jgi:hypothetical protein
MGMASIQFRALSTYLRRPDPEALLPYSLTLVTPLASSLLLKLD